MGPTFRLAEGRDLEVLLPLLEAFQKFERIPFDLEAARLGLGRLLEDLRLGRVYLAELEARAIGYAIVTYGYDLEFGGMDGYLTDLFLVEEARGLGHGRWLLDRVERAARAAGVLVLHLMVAPHNQRAHNLYHRAGFQVSPRLFLSKALSS